MSEATMYVCLVSVRADDWTQYALLGVFSQRHLADDAYLAWLHADGPATFCAARDGCDAIGKYVLQIDADVVQMPPLDLEPIERAAV